MPDKVQFERCMQAQKSFVGFAANLWKFASFVEQALGEQVRLSDAGSLGIGFNLSGETLQLGQGIYWNLSGDRISFTDREFSSQDENYLCEAALYLAIKIEEFRRATDSVG